MTLSIAASAKAHDLYREIETARATYLKRGKTLKQIQAATAEWISEALERNEITEEDAGHLRTTYSLTK